MSTYVRVFACSVFLLLFASMTRAQEGANGEKVTPPPPGVDKYYWDLAKSEDRVLRSHVDRYVGLVKIQEWSDQSGKFKAIGHYVKHDPQLKTVTIKVFRGRGADRTSEDKTVPVEKLSAQCQSRVKQIDIAQKKIRELAAKDGNAPVTETPAETASATPAIEERGPGGARGPVAGAEAAVTAAAPAAPEPDPSAAEPDPLGFAEVPLSSPGAARGPGGTSPEPTPPAAGGK